MKKLFLLMGMAAAMFSFAGCQENEIDGGAALNGEGSTFEIVAGIDQDATKTTLTDKDVEWEEGDVIYVVTPDGPWGLPYQEDNAGTSIAEYTYADGKFTSSATIENGEYEFLAMYTNQKSYHRQDASSHQLAKEQSQNCADPTAHIKANDALVGVFSAEIPMDAPAEVTMKHLYTMMQVDIKNNTGAAVEIKRFEMKAAGADLAGVFYVEDFYDAVITTKQNPSETVAVNVTGGSVASGATLPVYFVMAPISGYTGDVTFKVTDASGNTYSKTVAMTDITFEAGRYNTTPYAISTPDKVEAKGLPFVETFGSSLGEFTAQTVGALPDGLTYVWAYASGYGAKASAYVGGTRYNQTTYLVSPVLSLASVESAKMSFEHTGKHFTNMEEEAAVCVRIVGGDWETLTIPTYFSGNDWTFVNSGDIDLSDYVGKEIQIGFRYTSTSTSAGTWEIKNVEVCEKTVGGGEPDEPEGATTVTFDFTSADELTALGVVLPEAGNGTDISEMALVKDGVTMTATDGSTTTRVWNSSSGELDLRVYKNGGSLTLSVAEGNHITKVAFTGNDLVNFSSPVGSYSSSVWTGSSQSINFSASGTVKVKTISVTCVPGEGETPTIQPRNLAFSAATATATVGQPFTEPTLNGVTTGVTYTSSNESVATVNAETGAVTLVGAGTTTIKASAPATAEYEAGEASYTLTVAAAEILVEDGSYVIAVLEEGVYYAVSSDANDARRAFVELNDYSGEESYVSHNSKIVWTITNVVGGITINTGDQYWGTKKNGITLVTSNNAATIAVSRSENAYHLSGDCGADGIRYVSKNGTFGFGFYAEANKEDIYLIPATFVALPDLAAPVATAELNNAKDGINVSWNAVPNAQKYVVTCGENSVEVTATNHEFTGLSAGTYSITVKAVAENYNSATSEAVSVTVPSAGGGDEGGETTGGYTLITSLSDITTGQYVIAAKVNGTYYAMSNEFASKINGTSVTVTDNAISESDAVNYVVTITKNGTSFSISSGTKYLKYSSSTNLGTQNTAYNWTISEGVNGTFRATSGTSGRGILYRTGSYNQFGGYSLGNATSTSDEYFDIELFKLN